jgi:hypothetical protein
MSVHDNGRREINEAVLEVGKESLDLIQRFLSGRVTREELLSGLSGTGVKEVLTRYWGDLASNSSYVPHWQVLQTLQGLIDEITYQLGEYGESTIYEDFKDIAINLKRIAEQNN